LRKGGRNTLYNQRLTMRYDLPTNKFPLISSVSFSICSGSAIIRCNTAQTFDLIVSTNNSLVGASGNGEVNIVRIG
jgi:hypothetical protein